jgi:hypothetical protein
MTAAWGPSDHATHVHVLLCVKDSIGTCHIRNTARGLLVVALAKAMCLRSIA